MLSLVQATIAWPLQRTAIVSRISTKKAFLSTTTKWFQRERLCALFSLMFFFFAFNCYKLLVIFAAKINSRTYYEFNYFIISFFLMEKSHYHAFCFAVLRHNQYGITFLYSPCWHFSLSSCFGTATQRAFRNAVHWGENMVKSWNKLIGVQLGNDITWRFYSPHRNSLWLKLWRTRSASFNANNMESVRFFSNRMSATLPLFWQNAFDYIIKMHRLTLSVSQPMNLFVISLFMFANFCTQLI